MHTVPVFADSATSSGVADTRFGTALLSIIGCGALCPDALGPLLLAIICVLSPSLTDLRAVDSTELTLTTFDFSSLVIEFVLLQA